MKGIKEKIAALNVYPSDNIELMEASVNACSSEIRSAILDWLESQNETNISVEGVSFEDIKTKCKMNPLAAYLTLNWLKGDFYDRYPQLKKEYPEFEELKSH